LVKEKGFSEERIKKDIEKLKAARGKAVQGRLTDFFKVSPSPVKPTLKGKAVSSSGRGAKRGAAVGRGSRGGRGAGTAGRPRGSGILGKRKR